MSLRPAILYNQFRANRLITAPAVEPVTAAELRTQVRADASTLSDSEADSLIEQSRNYIEEMTGLAFITQTWRLTLDQWPGYYEPWWDGVREMPVTELAGGRPRDVTFPRYPLQSVSAVKTYDQDGTESSQTIATYFIVDSESRPGRMGLKAGQVWPAATQPINAVKIDYVAGFGATTADVPASLRAAVLTMAAYYYDHRGECDITDAYSKSGASALAATYMVRGV